MKSLQRQSFGRAASLLVVKDRRSSKSTGARGTAPGKATPVVKDCGRIRSGDMVPHARHWGSLTSLA